MYEVNVVYSSYGRCRWSSSLSVVRSSCLGLV